MKNRNMLCAKTLVSVLSAALPLGLMAYVVNLEPFHLDATHDGASIGGFTYHNKQFLAPYGSACKKMFMDVYGRNVKNLCEIEDAGLMCWQDLPEKAPRGQGVAAYGLTLEKLELRVEKRYHLVEGSDTIDVIWKVRNPTKSPKHFGMRTQLPVCPGNGTVSAETKVDADSGITAVWDASTGLGIAVLWPQGRYSKIEIKPPYIGTSIYLMTSAGVNEEIPAGGEIEFSAQMILSEDMPARLKTLTRPPVAPRGVPLLTKERTARKGGKEPTIAEAAALLEKDYRVPLKMMFEARDDVKTWHREWFRPAEKCDFLFLYAPYWTPIRDGRRFPIELCQRGEFSFRTIPLLNDVLNTYLFWVRTTWFGSTLSDWSMALIKAEKNLPRAAVFYKVDFKDKQEAVDVFKGWKDGGMGFLFVGCKNVPQELAGARSFQMATDEQGYVYTSREEPVFEKYYLEAARKLREVAGMMDDIRIVKADAQGIEIASKVAGKYALTTRFADLNRFEDGAKNASVEIKPGSNRVALSTEGIPSGMHEANVRLLDAAGKVVDAVTFKVKIAGDDIAVTVDRADGIYECGGEIVCSVTGSAVQKDAQVTTCLEDTDFRQVARFEGAQGTLKIPENATRLYRVISEVRRASGLVARQVREIAVRAPKRDLSDVSAYLTIWPGRATESFAEVAKWGFDYVIADFGDARAACAECANLGMQALPRNCADGPQWIGPYTFGRDPAGNVRKPCFTSPAFQKELETRIARAAEVSRYDYYNVDMHWVADEFFIGSKVCQSPSCLEKFRETLRVKYGTVEKLNQAWGTQYAAFGEVLPKQLEELKNRDNLAPWLEHKMFMSKVSAEDWLGAAVRELKRNVRGAKGGPTGTQLPSYGYDWTEIMKYAEGVGYYAGTQRKYTYDFAELYGKEILAGQCGGGYTDAHFDFEPYNYDTMWSGLLKGSNLAYHYFGAAINSDLSMTANMDYWVKSMHELKSGIGKLFLCAKEHPEVYVLYSQASLFAAIGTGREADWQSSQTSWWRLLTELKIPMRFYPYQMLAEKGVPVDAKVLVLPYSLALSAAEVTAIERFAVRGGLVLADVQPGVRDETGKKVNRQLNGVKIMGEKYCKHTIMSGGSVGESTGMGSADRKLKQELSENLGNVLAKAGVVPEVRVTDKNGREAACDAVLRKDGENWVLGVHRDVCSWETDGRGRFDFSKGEPVSIRLPQKGHVYDVREGTYLGYTDTIETSIVTAWTRMYSILREQPGALRITGPKSFRGGETLRFSFALENGRGPHVFHVELIRPDGVAPWRYRKNIRTENGRGEYVFETALNEQPGAWRLKVRDVNTGATSEHAVRSNVQQGEAHEKD